MEEAISKYESVFCTKSSMLLKFESTAMGLAKNNTFIFKWVQDYEDQTARLKETFENTKLGNRVEIFDNLTYAELKQTVGRLRLLNFALFRYITVIILDNKCDHGRFIQTKDNVKVLIDSEILTLLKTNVSLEGKPRLFVVQKLEDFAVSDDDVDGDDENGNRTTQVNIRSSFVHSSPTYQGLKRVTQGLEISLTANEQTDNFRDSPFIDIFCEEFLANSVEMPMDEIYGLIWQRTKSIHNVDIQCGSNQGRHDTGILGKAVDSSEERDFLEI